MKRGKYRKSVFIVTYAIEENKIYFLVLKRKLHWKGWEFPKGGVEKFEAKKKAVLREIKEETGQAPLRMKEHKFFGEYKYDKKYADRKGFVGQKFSLYSTMIKKRKIRFDKREHSDYKWLYFDKALKKLKWPNQKKALNIVKNDLNID